jgi:bifunctional DNA-binding transcriptional regulator/antitoxin component of YhaV-PrlF toxin-antitoxin module
MVKFKVKANPAGQYYFPKEVRQELGKELSVICNTKAAIFFPVNACIEDVLKSLQIIEADLKHRLQMQQRAKADDQATIIVEAKADV